MLPTALKNIFGLLGNVVLRKYVQYAGKEVYTEAIKFFKYYTFRGIYLLPQLQEKNPFRNPSIPHSLYLVADSSTSNAGEVLQHAHSLFYLDTNSNVTNSSRLYIFWSRKALKNYHSVLPQIHFKEQKCCGPQKSQLNRNKNVMQPDFTTSQSHGNSQVQG